MFRIYDETYLSRLLGITRREFHRKIKPMIMADFKHELQNTGIENPDIGLDAKNNIVLVHPSDRTIYFDTNFNISNYL